MFKKYRQKLFNRRHHIIVDEKDVLSAVKAITSCTKVPEAWNTFIRNAGWEHQPERWYVAFTCYNDEFPSVVGELVSVIPNVEIID